MDQPLLRVRSLSKRFPGVLALSNIHMTLGAGESLAIIGENGAGKSTLMKILAGVQLPNEGTIEFDGRQVAIESVQTALHLGIALIHQELNLSTNLDVGANIFLGREPGVAGFIDGNRVYEESKRILKLVGLDVDPNTIAGELPIGQQQLVEIAKALSVDARILIMDEPTSSLSQHETERLFEVIDQLKERGVSIIYISHRLGEVKRLADRVVVLRDGENAGELQRDEITHDNMVKLMVGRDVSQFYARSAHDLGDEAMRVEGLQTLAYPEHRLGFSIRAGEIVGVAGLVGAGRTEMLRAVFGVDHRLAGDIFVGANPLPAQHTSLEAINAGIALVPEDRKTEGLVLGFDVRRNTSLAALKRNRLMGLFLNFVKEDEDTEEMISKLRIKTPNAEQIVQLLSGGNQQKVVLGKWLSLQPRILLLDEPTRGIDIGAKQEIYTLMEELAKNGVAVLFVSSELEEVIGMADRVLVMHEGRITGELMRNELTEESIMQYATGGAKQEDLA